MAYFPGLIKSGAKNLWMKRLILGAKGYVEFAITGDGKALGSMSLKGKEPARLLECDVAGVSVLQFTLNARGTEPKSDYAIWAEPTLAKP